MVSLKGGKKLSIYGHRELFLSQFFVERCSYVYWPFFIQKIVDTGGNSWGKICMSKFVHNRSAWYRRRSAYIRCTGVVCVCVCFGSRGTVSIISKTVSKTASVTNWFYLAILNWCIYVLTYLVSMSVCVTFICNSYNYSSINENVVFFRVVAMRTSVT